MGEECSAYGGEERRIQGFGGGDPGVDGRVILRWILSGMWGYGLGRAGSG